MAHDIFKKDMVFVDIETTGYFHGTDKIIEIGILKTRDGELVETFSTLVNPEIAINEDVTKVTAISKDDLAKAPVFKDIKDEVYRLLKDSTFFAHNSQFDYNFLEFEFLKHELPFSLAQVCTVKLSQFLYPAYQRHNLDSISSRFSIPIERRHRALDDANAIWEFFKIVRQNFDDYTLGLAIDKVLKPAKQVKTPTESQMSLI